MFFCFTEGSKSIGVISVFRYGAGWRFTLLVSIVLQFSWSLIKKGGRNMLNGFINFVAIDKSLLIHEFIL